MILILLSIILNLLIVLNYKKISELLDIYDYPDKIRKIHSKKIPLIGGIIIYINFFFIFIFVIFIPDFFDTNLKSFFIKKSNFINLFLISSLIMFMGIYDDKKNLNAYLKFLILIILTFFLLKFNNDLIIQSIFFSSINYEIYTHDYGIYLTILCFLLFINASNMYDGINLQLGPYFVFIFFIFIFRLELYLFSSLLLIPLFIFCCLNYNGKIFIGNSGAYFVSFLVSSIFIIQNNFTSKISTEEIFLIMSMPGLDMLRLFIYRIFKKKNPFSPDKKHLHHYMIKNFNTRISQVYIFLINIAPFCFYQLYESLNMIFITLAVYILLYILLFNKKTKDVN
ncbi:MraY family glycosyltransferase [Candidatus Pelagibacter sp.]|uniref:MraY family glycosyltransferase n=1 Tax=Candidatus Pelagibacter sp. TaxID=2024849 RepID=UPI003D108E3F